MHHMPATEWFPPFTKRGHEQAWSYPPRVNGRVQRPKETNILRCDDVKGLEQGIYIISRPLRRNPINTPEGRHHIYLQVYQDPDSKAKINLAQANLDKLEEIWRLFDHGNLELATERNLLEEKLAGAKQTLEKISQNANRALMMENSGPTLNGKGKPGSVVTIASVDHGQTLLPDLNQPYLVISPILTISDVEKVGGKTKWVDPDMNSYSECIAKIRSILYTLFGHNCKVAALELAKSAVNAIPGLTSEMRKTAEENLAKPINANIPLSQIVRNTVVHAAQTFKQLKRHSDGLPKTNFERNDKRYTNT